MKENIELLRAQLDALDDALLDLLDQRARLSLRVGEFKRLSGAPVRQPAREAAILSRLGGLAAQRRSPLNQAQLESVYRAIFAVSRQLQEER